MSGPDLIRRKKKEINTEKSLNDNNNTFKIVCNPFCGVILTLPVLL